MKTTNVLLGLIGTLLAIIIILLLRNNPINFEGPKWLSGLTAKLTEPPGGRHEYNDFTFEEGSSNKTCLIVYNDSHDMFDTPIILQSNLVHSTSEIIQELGKYGWEVSSTNENDIYMERPDGMTNGFFFVGDPDNTNKVLIP